MKTSLFLVVVAKLNYETLFESFTSHFADKTLFNLLFSLLLKHVVNFVRSKAIAFLFIEKSLTILCTVKYASLGPSS